MLTCKVGENIINCFDGTYDKHQLKKWSDKNILICPDCGKPYEYCHGRIIPPYFRHKDKEENCNGIYSEPETKEHIEGKLFLYNWLIRLKNKGLVNNVKLEGYISETKQRPDLYFECGNDKYVFEFQCSPISTEYLERHELYQLANINDIWILGLDKYNIELDDKNYIVHSSYYKTIEKYTSLYLNSELESLYVKNNAISKHLPYNKIILNDYYLYKLKDFEVNTFLKTLSLKEIELKKFINKDIKLYEKYLIKFQLEQEKLEIQLEQKRKSEELELSYKNIINGLNDKYKCQDIEFSFRAGNPSYYLWGIDFISKEKDYTFFIKENSIDCCTIHTYSSQYEAYSRKKHKYTKRWGK